MRYLSTSLILMAFLSLSACLKSEAQTTQQTPSTQPTTNGVAMTKATATFAAGCFWGVEETFRKLPGVLSTTVGYTGGNFASPTYQDVCSDNTGHAEAVQIDYDPSKVSYDQLLDIFWANHNPTTLNRQGPDIGSQYRSAIFYHSPEQQAAAQASKAKLEAAHRYKKPIVTQIVPAATFWPAEEYHQKYLLKHGRTFCHTPEADE